MGKYHLMGTGFQFRKRIKVLVDGGVGCTTR